MCRQLLDESLAALRVRVTAVHKAVDESILQSVFLRDVAQFEQMFQRRVHITGSSNLSEEEIRRAMQEAAAFAGQDKERKAALEALNAAEAALYRVNTALGSKAGKALDRDTRSRIKESERALEKATRHKKAEKLTPADVQAIRAALASLSDVAAPLVARWESERSN